MDDTRRRARQALEAEWGDDADRPGLEARVLGGLAPRAAVRAGGFGWTGAIAASLGALMALTLVVAGLRLAGLHDRRPGVAPAASASASPSAAPSVAPSVAPTPVPEQDYGRPPTGRALFWYVDPRQPSWLVAADWTGRPRGTLKIPVGLEYGAVQSRDGSRLLLNRPGTTSYLESYFLDAQGNSLGVGIHTNDLGFPFWADDNRHLCYVSGMLPQAAPAPVLMSLLPGARPRRVTPFGTGRDAYTAYVQACSLAGDRALVGEYANSDRNSQRASLIRLSTGATLRQFSQQGEGGDTVMGSPDLAYLAVAGPAGVRVVQADSGKQAGQPLAGVTPLAFSADGARLLVEGSQDAGGTDLLRLVDWRTGRVVWSLDRSVLPEADDRIRDDDVLAGPGGDLALAFHHPECSDNPALCAQAQRVDPFRDVLIVHPDGSTMLFASRVTWFTAQGSFGLAAG